MMNCVETLGIIKSKNRPYHIIIIAIDASLIPVGPNHFTKYLFRVDIHVTLYPEIYTG